MSCSSTCPLPLLIPLVADCLHCREKRFCPSVPSHGFVSPNTLPLSRIDDEVLVEVPGESQITVPVPRHITQYAPRDRRNMLMERKATVASFEEDGTRLQTPQLAAVAHLRPRGSLGNPTAIELLGRCVQTALEMRKKKGFACTVYWSVAPKLVDFMFPPIKLTSSHQVGPSSWLPPFAWRSLSSI